MTTALARQPAWLRINRWWGLLAGVVLATSDTVTLRALGITLEVNGRDATLLVGGFFGASFALLGFLVGYVVEGRRRDRQASALIREQVETIAATRARLAQSEKLAALGQLATAIAHEVRNPLAVIRSAAQGIAETEAGADAATRRACGFITDEIDRLGSVVTSLLAFARPPQLQPRPVPVRELLDRAAVLARDELDARAVRLARETAVDLPALRADPDLVCQVLLGLLSNGAEAAGAGGEVRLEARATDGRIELAVTDSGPGVPPELRDRVFEPFFTTRPRGTGLGLAVARQIVEAHGGQIAVTDRPGGGARFTIRLPAAADAAVAA
jgi:two-component system sensor histidine kinase HydH